MLADGTILGNHEIPSPLGAGGMGVVYRARHALIGHDVALKMLSPNLSMQQKVVHRFRQEAYVQASLDHPNIVRVSDMVIRDRTIALVMDLVRGPSLEDVLHEMGGSRWSFEVGLTRTGATLGTVSYMPPGQFKGNTEVDVRATTVHAPREVATKCDSPKSRPQSSDRVGRRT